MAERFATIDETLGYQTATDPTNSPPQTLVAGSQNVLIDQQKKVKSRAGYTYFGPRNPALTPVKPQAPTWNSSSGVDYPMRPYSTILEAYLGTVDGVVIDAYTQIMSGLNAVNPLRFAPWYDATEVQDALLFVQGDANEYDWSGGVAVAASSTTAAGIIQTLAAAPTAGGTGYTIGDILTITTGGANATATVLTLGASNAVATVSILARGTGYTIASGQATSGGTGTGATLNVTAIATGSITKAGTTTFVQNRFYTARNLNIVNVRTGTVYPYLVGTDGLTLVGTGASTDIIAGDILIQQVATQTNSPIANHTNDTIFVFNNQVYIGSNGDDVGYISKNTSYHDFSFSTPRLTGEGGILTLDAPINGFGAVGNNIVAFAGRSSMFSASYAQISIDQGSSSPAILSETINVKKLNTGTDQSAQNQECIIPIGNQLAYLSFEPALRIIKNPSDIEGIDPQTYSNPIKPDFDGIDWTGATMLWFKNTINISAPTVSRLYILEFTQDADGVTTRFWQAPQILPVQALSIIDDGLYGHSNAVPETYQLFTGGADGDYTGIAIADRIPFKAIARFAYSDAYFIPKKLKMYANRSALKCFDQYYSEGEVAPGTQISLNLYYDFGGATQVINKVVNGEDGGIVQEDINLSSLGQSSFGQQPLGGSSVEPSNKLRYKVIFDIPMEDYYQIAEEYITEAVDAYFAVISRGPNAGLSSHTDTLISR